MKTRKSAALTAYWATLSVEIQQDLAYDAAVCRHFTDVGLAVPCVDQKWAVEIAQMCGMCRLHFFVAYAADAATENSNLFGARPPSQPRRKRARLPWSRC